MSEINLLKLNEYDEKEDWLIYDKIIQLKINDANIAQENYKLFLQELS